MVNTENAEEVVNNLTMIVDLADPEDDQTADNFEAITRVIVDISDVVTRNISLQPLINVCYMEQLITFNPA